VSYIPFSISGGSHKTEVSAQLLPVNSDMNYLFKDLGSGNMTCVFTHTACLTHDGDGSVLERSWEVIKA
jgi:hypothetical protein